jgi:hypothetical protein
VRTIEHWQHDGFVVSIKIGSVVRYHWPDVLQQLKTLRSATAVSGGAPSTDTSPRPSPQRGEGVLAAPAT